MKKATIPLVLVLLSGCAGLSYRTADVSFEDPFTRLGIVPSEATPQEQAGVLLRLKPPAMNALKSREETTVYSQIQEDRGVENKLVQTRNDTYERGSQNDSFIIRSKIVFEGQSGASVEEIETTTRGEILKFIRGFYDLKGVKLKITDWKRTPVFPKEPVKIGDEWNYEESMSRESESFPVTEEGQSPFHLQAKSKLTGFAEVGGKRCAVIETQARQIETERLKILFKKRTFYIQATINESAFLDYQSGTVLAKIAKVQTYTNSADGSVNDHSTSQTLSYLSTSPEAK